MNKEFYKSKTLWGLAIASVIVIAQILGVEISQNNIAELVKVIGAALSVYGLRDAID